MNKRGFTLIEAITALAIIGIVALFLVSIFASSFNISSRSISRNQNSHELQKLIEDKQATKERAILKDFTYNFDGVEIKYDAYLNTYATSQVNFTLIEGE